MQNNPAPDLHNTTGSESTSLFGQTKLGLDKTPEAIIITPFGGLASFITFLVQIGYVPMGQRHLAFADPNSPDAISLAHALTTSLVSVVEC